MAKDQVYSWRLSIETKAALEERARQERSSVSELLDRIVAEWLSRDPHSNESDAEQQRLHEAALKTIGTIQGDDPDRAIHAKDRLRARLARKRAR